MDGGREKRTETEVEGGGGGERGGGGKGGKRLCRAAGPSIDTEKKNPPAPAFFSSACRFCRAMAVFCALPA
jgi:hypothetical protein